MKIKLKLKMDELEKTMFAMLPDEILAKLLCEFEEEEHAGNFVLSLNHPNLTNEFNYLVKSKYYKSWENPVLKSVINTNYFSFSSAWSSDNLLAIGGHDTKVRILSTDSENYQNNEKIYKEVNILNGHNAEVKLSLIHI